jgi:uncharacterized protein YkwD
MVLAMSPRLLLAAAVVVCALLALPAASDAKRKGVGCANAQVAPSAASLELVRGAVLCLHNRERAARGLPRLTEQAQLSSAAEGHSAHMVEAQFFAHDAPGGADMVGRIFGAGYQGSSIGENIAWGSGGLGSAAAIHRAWMRSPGHRANILRRQFREIGIGIALGAPVADAGDDGATYTADFGVRR